MNCKPNDIAVIVSTLGQPAADSLLGKIVKVISMDVIDPRVGPMWRLEEPVWFLGTPFNAIADAALRPLRDPGDDAVDEMVRWCPAPKTTVNA